MAEYTPSALSTFTTFFSSENIKDTARRTGFVKRASHMTGTLLLALVTCGVWSDPTTTLAQWAAQVTQWDERVEVLPEALHQRMRATVWLKKKRERSVREVVRHVQALADRWMHAIFQSELTLRRFLQRACATAER